MFLGKQSGVGEAVIVGLAKDDVVKNSDAEDLRCFDQAVCAVRPVGNGRVLENSVVPNGTRYRIFFPFPGTEVPLYIHRVPDGTRLFNNGCKTFLRWALSALA